MPRAPGDWPYFADTNLSDEERFDRQGAAAYALVIRRVDQLGWVFRMSSYDRFATSVLRRLNTPSREEVASGSIAPFSDVWLETAAGHLLRYDEVARLGGGETQ